MIRKFVKFDVLSRQFSFEENHSKNFKSLLGAFASMCLIISSVVVSIMFGREIYERKSPVIVESTQFVENSIIKLNNLPFVLLATLPPFDKYNDILKILDLKVKRMEFASDHTLYRMDFFKLSFCNETHYNQVAEHTKNVEELEEYNALLKTFYNNKKEKNKLFYFCLDPEIEKSVIFKNYTISNQDYNLSNSNIFIKNKFANPNSAFFQISGQSCNNKNKNCEESIEDIIDSEINISINYINTYIDSSNFKNPVRYYEDAYVFKLNKNFNKKIVMSFYNKEYRSDNGWMLEDNTDYKYISADKFTSEISRFYDEYSSSNTLFEINLESPNFVLKTNRKYMKIQELIAKVGGLVKGFTLCIQIIFMHLFKFNYLMSIFNIIVEHEKGNTDYNFKFTNLKKPKDEKNYTNTSSVADLKHFNNNNNILLKSINKNIKYEREMSVGSVANTIKSFYNPDKSVNGSIVKYNKSNNTNINLNKEKDIVQNNNFNKQNALCKFDTSDNNVDLSKKVAQNNVLNNNYINLNKQNILKNNHIVLKATHNNNNHHNYFSNYIIDKNQINLDNFVINNYNYNYIDYLKCIIFCESKKHLMYSYIKNLSKSIMSFKSYVIRSYKFNKID